jgi:integrase
MSDSLTVNDVLMLYSRYAISEGIHGAAAKAERAFTFRLFRAACGHLTVAECKPYHLTDLIESHPQWKSVATRRKVASDIRAAFNWAYRQERIDRNLFANVRYGEAERRPELPDVCLDAINDVANKPTERVLRFIRLTAWRAAEVCNAVWADVDLERGIWSMPNHKSRKHTGRAKVVALVPEAVEILRATAGRTDPHRPIFTITRGKPWTRGNLWQAITRLKERQGIEAPGALHTIRHRAASAMVVAGAPLALVAAQLGHANPTVTSKYYVHLENQMDAIRDAASLGVPRKAPATQPDRPPDPEPPSERPSIRLYGEAG